MSTVWSTLAIAAFLALIVGGVGRDIYNDRQEFTRARAYCTARGMLPERKRNVWFCAKTDGVIVPPADAHP